MNPGPYCRDVESYLCRKNDGHLIRIVGPAFEMVCGWAEQEIPLRVVYAAVDRTFARYYAKGPRRRPVRIEFCEADVLEQFDEWRRAVGVRYPEATDTRRERRSLRTHVTQVIERLDDWHHQAEGPAVLADPVREARGELQAIGEAAGVARGEKRRRLIASLRDIEHRLIATLRADIDPDTAARLRGEATRELEPFRDRMPPETFRRSVEAGTDRLLYDHAKLPRVAYE